MRQSRVYIALMHYPMYNKRMDVITTSVTNLDLHDIARTARTYDVDGFFVVHPSESQHELIRRITGFWQQGYGASYNPDRKEAFDLLKVVYNLEEAVAAAAQESGLPVNLVATDARVQPNSVSFAQLKTAIQNENKAFIILFGTGWGMHKDLLQKCHYILEPVEPGRSYNHLSVRSAAAIILDRLLGESWYNHGDFLEQC
ncbi:MAG TPA: RNA methyltransferase [Syntrophomonadaceae bacterium]|nr:RNA methyltransferase [Syntrophomonadaceae bacterium]HPU48948.1 RNA methyltransferase [Syntrophomonadaceae bacterium]